jgi:non-specific serine/threonine protein kinase
MSEVQQSLEEFARRYPAAPVWRAAAAYALVVVGRTDAARRAFEALCADGLAEVPRDGEWLSALALLIGVAERLDDARRSAELAELLAPHASRAVITGRGATCLGPVSRFVAVALAAAGRREEAIASYEAALATARRWGAEPIVAAIRLELAALVDDRARARGLREAGLEVARRLQLRALLERWDEAPAPAVVVAEPAPAAPAAAAGRPAPGARPMAFYRRGDIWTIGTAAATIQLRHGKGLTHIVRLLGAPHVEFHALDLVAGSHDRGSSAALAIASGMELHGRGAGDAGPVLDGQAKAAYRGRVVELQEEIAEAEAFNDPERAARARDELAFLARELAGAVGLGGRDRKTGSDAERARVNVTRAIRTALKRIADQDPALGRSLGSAIRTGTFCVYEPVPGEEPEWDLAGPG